MDATAASCKIAAETTPLFKKRGAKNIRKRATTPPAAALGSELGYTSTEDEGRKVKRRRKTASVSASSNSNAKAAIEDLAATKFAADRSAQISETNDATKTSNWYDDNITDVKGLLGTSKARPPREDGENGGDGTYKGAAGYTSFIKRNPDAPSRTVGPVKAPTNIRTITVTDFAPDVCKDYKQTGFCGFGDSCKFLHAREDYKQGWELDKEWEKVGDKAKKGTKSKGVKDLADAEDSEEEDAALEGIPFACIVCKKSYTNPIVTKCGHYFCEACALQRYRKNPSCAACGAGTGGVFNGAKGLRKILERKTERARKRRERALEAGEEVSEEEVDGDGEDGE